MKGSAFLHPDQRELFDREYERYPRFVRPHQDGAKNTGLQDLVRDGLDSFDAAVGTFRCRVVGVRDGDGSSWAATAADKVVDTPKYSVIERVHLQGLAKPDTVAEIAGVIGFNRLASLAQKHSLAGPSAVEAPWVRPGLLILALAVGLAGVVAKQVTAQAPGKPSVGALLDPSFLVPAIATAVIGLVGQWIMAYLKVGQRATIAKLSVPENADSTSYGEFVADIADTLASGIRSRCLIVDRYDRLSPLTKSVLRSYLTHHAGLGGERFELWIVFDRSPYNEFRHSLEVVRFERGSLPNVKFYDLVLLPAADRRRLATERGHPEREGFEAVGAIASDIEPSTFDAVFEAQMRHPGATTYGPLDFFYVIAITTSCGGNWTVPGSFLESNFRDKDLKRNIVLQQLLLGTKLDKHETHESVRSIKALFGQHGILTVSHDGDAFDIAPEVGRALSARWKDFGLADPRLCHLFWSLFWRDKLGSHPKEPFWIDKLTKHVLAVGPLRELNQNAPDIRKALFEAAMFAAESGLAVSLLFDIPELLERAIVLIADDDPTEAEKQIRRVHRACWQTYSVIGDDRILETIETLRSWTKAGADGRRPVDALDAIFVESVGGKGAPGWEHEQGPVRIYGRLRAIWLIQTMAPFLGSAAPSLQAAGSHISDELLDAAHSPHVRLVDAENRHVINYLCSSLTLWCLAIGASRSPATLELPAARIETLVNDLEYIVLHAVEIFQATRRATNATGNDLAGLGATNEVIVLARICAGRLAIAFQESNVEESLQKRLIDIACWDPLQDDAREPEVPHNGGGEVAKALADAEGRLNLMHVMWAGMGFTQLGEFSNLRCAQLVTMSRLGAGALPSWEVVSRNLSIEETRRGYVGLLANSIEAYAAGRRRELAANLVSRGVNLAFTGGHWSRLRAELALVVIAIGSIFELDFLPFLNAVAAPDRKGRRGRFLAAILKDAEDPAIADVSQSLFNALRQSQAPEIADDVTVNLERRIQEIGKPDVQDEARQTVDLFNIEARIRQAGGIDAAYVDTTLTAWDHRRLCVMYDSMLVGLLNTSSGLSSGRLLDEVWSALSKCAGESKLQSNAPLLIAIRVAGLEPKVRSGRPLDPALSVLRAHLPQMPEALTAESQIQGYQTLERLDPGNRQQYRLKVAYWDQVRHDRDELRLLPALLGQRAYFRLLLHYFVALSIWGLRSSIDPAEMQKRFDMTMEQRIKAFAKIHNLKQPLATPFVALDGVRYLDGDFLWYGYCLNSEPFDTEKKKYDELREEFDSMAQQALPEFYRLVSQSNAVPVGVREALARHETRMLSYTQPK